MLSVGLNMCEMTWTEVWLDTIFLQYSNLVIVMYKIILCSKQWIEMD